ncbi:hypothetical protein GCM10009087_55530 [Sphingomonas oligophenolica]|uniref:DUF308 domain-containing protein n=1 Tax=Sphingomonas oligophenolica TaxID=301154 RepID=A0ABU9Y5A8_9SPHN
MASSASPDSSHGKGWVLAYGILSAAIGVAAFVWPVSATITATLLFGSFLFVAGIMALATGFRSRAHHASTYRIVYGILSILVGLVILLEPATGAISITLLVAFWLAMRGIFELFWGYRFPIGRALMIALGLINLLLAIFIIWTIPLSALTLPGYLLGISFLMTGVTAIAEASAA